VEEETTQFLSKREKRLLAKEQKREEREQGEVFSRIKKFGIWILVIGFLVAGIWWLWRQSTKPLPGQEVADLGREHITDIAGVNYNSNPPTSGTHFPVWAKKGVYDGVLSDGYLIHSLEHGYVVISYDCTKSVVGNQWSVVSEILAHDEPTKESTDSGELLKHMKFQPSGETSWFTPENPPEDELDLPNEFDSEGCKNLVANLSKFVQKWDRVIVVPRPNLETQVALTAWTRIDKLEGFDEDRIENFIKAFHNKGPEKTME